MYYSEFRIKACISFIKFKNTILLIIIGLLLVNVSDGKTFHYEDSLNVDKLIKSILDSPLMQPKRILAIGDEIFNYSTNRNYNEGLVRGLIAKAVGNGRMGNTKNSIDNYLQAVTIAHENKLYKHEANALNGIGQMYERLGINDKAFDCYSNSLLLYEKLNDSSKIAFCYTFLGTSLNALRKYEDAKIFFFRSLALNRKLHKINAIVNNCNDIGAIYVEQKNYPEAFHYLLEGLHITDSLHDTLSNPYLNIGACYQEVGKYDSALYFYMKSLRISKMLGDIEKQGAAYTDIGILYYKRHLLKEGEDNTLKGLKIAQEISDNYLLLGACTNLSDIYLYKHDYKKAYEYQVLAYGANDSLMNNEKEKAMAEMQVRFEVKELEDKNTILKKDNDLKQIKIIQKNIFIYSFLGVAVLFLIIALQVLRHNKLRANQQLLLLEQKQLLAQMNPHFIFNCLNSIQQYIIQNDAENANKYLADFALLMRQTLDNSKDGIIPLKREIEYLENYLSLECMRFENKFLYNINIANEININTIEIPSMIIQPFVENSIQHGLRNLVDKAGMLNINFYKQGDSLYCEVDDNGIGMEESQRLKEQKFIKYQSHGMELTKQRLALVSKMNSSDYHISVVNKVSENGTSAGTNIKIKFPLKA